MERESLEKLTLGELCDLLVDETVALLEAMDKKADGLALRDQKRYVELLQQMIRERRSPLAV